MLCPLKFNSLSLGNHIQDMCKCEHQECAWWEERFGKCAIAVNAYLEGREDHQAEVRDFMRNRH